jgi:2-oxoacid:acceptor oxidoreductase gamma subunit (pyruvate/2-ketoisovalerate family)
MIEIKFYGRGGQGAVIASQILAKVFFLMGKYPQCFSVFGGERRGAPVASFLRVDEKKIFLKCEIRRPDHMIYMAPDLVDEKEVEATLKPGGLILINNALTTSDFAGLRKFRLALIDALAVAGEAGLGSTINTAILGAYARAAGEITMPHLEQAIRETVPAKVEANVTAAQRAYELTRVMEVVNR